jgi:short subunit dehydrogenase-like uncharacterized protein
MSAGAADRRRPVLSGGVSVLSCGRRLTTIMSAERTYDIVLFGATGFTGGLTAEYLADHAPAGTRWALAGRSAAKLEALRTRLSVINPACAGLPLLHADIADANSVRTLAALPRVLASTVGPYINHGEPIVAACAEAGTDYVDITAESEFVDLMYLRYHQQAVNSSARMVHCCGFDSIPYDLGAYFTVKQLPEDAPIRLEAFVRIGLKGPSATGARFSAGSLQSALTMLSRPRRLISTHLARRKLEAQPAGRRARTRQAVPRYERSIGAWVLPAPTIDRQVVLRSAAALDRYGPDFSYRQYVAVDRPLAAAGMACGVAAVFLLAQLRATRSLLLGRVNPGTGPTPAQREGRWFRLHFKGEGGGDRVVSEVSGGDPGYGETSKMLAESALSLAHDELAPTYGQLTPAAAMGEALIERLRRRGISFSVLET